MSTTAKAFLDFLVSDLFAFLASDLFAVIFVFFLFWAVAVMLWICLDDMGRK